MRKRDTAWFLHETDDNSELDNIHKRETQAQAAVSTNVEPLRYRRGDVVTLRATVHNRYTDADAARRRDDDGQRLDLVLPSGKVVLSVPASDLEPAKE